MSAFITIPLHFIDSLNEDQSKLLGLTVLSHQEATAHNHNLSREVCKAASDGSGNPINGIVAAILSIGGRHAPLVQARETLVNATRQSLESSMVDDKYRVPGFGNSFFMESIDPAWKNINDFIEERYPSYHIRLKELGDIIHDIIGVRLYPNAAIFTAITCEICCIPRGMEYTVLIFSRLPIWAQYAKR